MSQSLTLGTIATGESVPGPSFTSPQSFTLGTIPSATGTIGGPSFTGGAAPDAQVPRIAVRAYSRAGALLADLVDSFERQWQDPLNDAGTGSFKLQNDDADIGDIDYGDVIRFSIDDQTRFAILVERKDRTSISQSEEMDENTTVSGRGTLAMLEEAVVRPDFGTERALFQDTRRFDYGSPDLDDSTWGPAVQSYMGKGAGEYPSVEDVRGGAPAGWPDATAWWIWDRFSSTLESADPMPVGDVYFRHTFEVTADDGQLLGVFASCDNQFQLVIDGVDVMEDQSSGGLGWGETKRVDVFLDEGVHQLALRCTNIFQRSGVSNPAGLIFAVYSLSQTLEPDTVLLHSDSSWLCLGYPPAPPGFTPGEVIRVVVDEAQTDGALDGLVLGFTDATDSVGMAWPTTPDISVQVGLDLLSFIRQLCETYMDVRMAPASFTLYAYTDLGTVTSVALDAGVNLMELSHDESV